MRRKPLCIVFTLLAAAAVAGRIALYFTSIDPETGFYTASARTVGMIASVAFAAGMILCVVLFRLLSEPKAGVIARAPELGVVSFGMAVALGFDTIASLVRPSVNSPVLNYIVGFFALLAMAYFICSGVDFLRGGRCTPGVLFGAVPLWSAVKLALFYTRFHGVIYISEGVLEVFALALTMMFWLYHTRMVTGMNSGRAAQWGYGFGISAAAACAMVTLPRMAAGLMGRSDLTAHGSDLEITSLISILYIVVFLVRYHIASVQSPVLEEEGEDVQELQAAHPLEHRADAQEVNLRESTASAQEEQAAESVEAAKAVSTESDVDDRIDRMVNELMQEKQDQRGDQPLNPPPAQPLE